MSNEPATPTEGEPKAATENEPKLESDSRQTETAPSEAKIEGKQHFIPDIKG